MQINSAPLLHASSAPGALSRAPGTETAINANEATFASALARMREDIFDASAIDEDGSEAEFVDIGETDGPVEEETDHETPKIEQEAPVSSPVAAVSEHLGLRANSTDGRDENISNANRSDDHQLELASMPQAQGTEALPEGSAKGDHYQVVHGQGDGETQLVGETVVGMNRDRQTNVDTSRIPSENASKEDTPPPSQMTTLNGPDRAPIIAHGVVAAPQMSAIIGNVPAPADTAVLPSERGATYDSILNGLWGAKAMDSAAKPVTVGAVHIGQETLQGVLHAVGVDEAARMVAASETETAVELRAKVTARPDASQGQDQFANALASGSASLASLVPATETAGSETLASLDDSPEWAASRSVGATGIAMPGPAEAIVARPDIVRNAAAYAVEIFAREPGKTVEIALNPEELGRVRMALSPSDAGVTVLITSERPETLELMRRHIEQLSQEFRRLGYEQASFEFNSEGSGSDDSSPKGGHARTDAASATGETQNAMPTRLIQTGLDLRL